MTSPSLELYSGLGPNPMVVLLFIQERCPSLPITISTLDIMNNENRKPPYRTEINPRGTLPALRIRNDVGDGNADFILTEVTAICEYLDELATTNASSSSLFGTTPLERAETQMWLRRTDLEIATPVHSYYRNDPNSVDLYKGWRVPTPEARLSEKIVISQALNRLDEELIGKQWLCGDRFSVADVFLYGMLKLMVQAVPFVVQEGRFEFLRWWGAMNGRESVGRVLKGMGVA